MLLGTGHLLCTVSEQALVANTTAAASRDSTFGYYTFAAAVGVIAATGIALALTSGVLAMSDRRGG